MGTGSTGLDCGVLNDFSRRLLDGSPESGSPGGLAGASPTSFHLAVELSGGGTGRAGDPKQRFGQRHLWASYGLLKILGQATERGPGGINSTEYHGCFHEFHSLHEKSGGIQAFSPDGSSKTVLGVGGLGATGDNHTSPLAL